MKRKLPTILIVLFLVLLRTNVNGQTDLTNFDISCENRLTYDTLTIERWGIRYKVISRHTDLSGGIKSVHGDIILPDENKSTDRQLLRRVLTKIGSMYKINTFYAFQSCTAHFIYSSSFAPGSKERQAVDSQIIGVFDLSEKER